MSVKAQQSFEGRKEGRKESRQAREGKKEERKKEIQIPIREELILLSEVIPK